jgi:plastocyanin
MPRQMDRRQFLKVSGLASLGSVLCATGLGCRPSKPAGSQGESEFIFAQLSDPHWGFSDSAINPDFAGTLSKAIAAVNAWDPQPDFVVFTGDLSQTTDDDTLRRQRMSEVRQMIRALKARDVRFLPGEHDAALDGGAAFREVFGPTHYVFDHKGIHFIALDNVSDPHGALGTDQLGWLESELGKLDKDSRIVVLTHRPLFDLAADWDWATADGDAAVDLLRPFPHVAVLYGHIHQVHNHSTDQIEHHSAMGLMWPLPAPHSVPKKAPVPWDPAHPYKGLGYRSAKAGPAAARYELTDYEVKAVAAETAAASEKVIKVTAKKFEYNPAQIVVVRGQPVVLELTSLDRLHGFNCPALGVRADVEPGKVSRVRFTPQEAGTFEFHCDIFCGSGHANMRGTIVVEQ